MLWTIWFALLAGISLLLACSIFLNVTGAAPDLGRPVVSQALGLISLLILVVAFFLPRLLSRDRATKDWTAPTSGAPDREKQLRQGCWRHLSAQQGRFLLGWAAAEGAGLLALIGTLVGGFVPLLIAPVALTYLLFLIQSPVRSRVDTPLIDFLTENGVPTDESERLIASL